MPAKGVAVVTGASYGLGATIAKQLACEAKYEVVLVARWVNFLSHLCCLYIILGFVVKSPFCIVVEFYGL